MGLAPVARGDCPQALEVLADLKKFGWRSTHVASGGKEQPAFTYSTGFWHGLRQPELIVFDMPAGLAHDILGQAYRRLSGADVLPTERPISGLLAGEDLYLFEVKGVKVAEYFVTNHWFYKGMDVPSMQIVWPDRLGLFPWQTGFDAALGDLQPDISKTGWGRLR